MANHVDRRGFLKQTAALVGATPLVGSSLFGAPAILRPGSANERLDIGIIGTANRAADNINGVKGENIVAVCDIDDGYLSAAKAQFPAAQTFIDFRKLLDLGKLDAMVISTPDHMHVPASVAALKHGKHVYCEKPLSHTVWEARTATKLAAEKKLATQLGTQIHATDNYRRVVEHIRAGAIGRVNDVHVWVGKTWSGGERPTDQPPVPASIHWDQWVGPAPMRPYHPTYLPANWRRWWDFGNGTLGDMGCHHVDLPYWALALTAPTRVEAEGPPPHPETTPDWMIVKYEFPANGERPPVKMTWYDGGPRPELLKNPGMPAWGDGTLFVGDKGMLLADYDRCVLLPEEKFKDFKAPEPTIPRSIGHYAEWIQACKTGSPTTCSFDYSGPLSETILLGMVAFRAGKPITWDSANLRCVGNPEADRFVRRDYRAGWEL